MAINGQNQIKYDDKDKEIRIQKAGMYYVYSQVTFQVTDKPVGTPSVLCHSVVRAKPGGLSAKLQDTLLNSMQTACNGNANTQDITSFIGSVFQLERGDALFVKVYNKDIIKPIPEMNFFGAHMI